MRALVLLALPWLGACASSAPHTLGAAAINTALATGAAAGSRASGGCYATCTHGTVCNPRTGLCDRMPSEVAGDAPSAADDKLTLQLQQARSPAPPPSPAGPIGISPATGSVPPPPAEASPRSD